MSWKSAHAQLDTLIKKHYMLYRMARDDIDNGEFVYGRKIICCFPVPAMIARHKRRAASQQFAAEVLTLRIRPAFDAGDETRTAIFPKHTHVRGLCEVRGMSSWWLEVVCTPSYYTALQAMKGWRADVADWKQNKGAYQKAA